MGIHFKKILAGQNQIEFTSPLSGTVNYIQNVDRDYSFDSIDPAISFGGGYSFFIKSTFVRRKEELKKNYISPKIAYDIGSSNSVYGIISWHRERFLAENKKINPSVLT